MTMADFNLQNIHINNQNVVPVPIAFDEFAGMDVIEFDNSFLLTQSIDENNSGQNLQAAVVTENESFTSAGSNSNSSPNSRLRTEDSPDTLAIADAQRNDSCDSDTDSDYDDSSIHPVMQPFVINTLNMLRDQIPYTTGLTINFPLRFNKGKKTLDFKNLEKNPFKEFDQNTHNTMRKPVFIVLMRDYVKRWRNPFTPKLLSKLADQDFQPVVFTMEEPRCRHYIYDLLKRVKRVKNGFLSEIDLDNIHGMNRVMQYLVMNCLAKVLKTWNLNVLIVDSNPHDVIRHNWIVEFAYKASIPVMHVPALGTLYSCPADSNSWFTALAKQDDSVVQKAYDSIAQFLSVNHFLTDRYCFIQSADGCVSTVLKSVKSCTKLPRLPTNELKDFTSKKNSESVKHQETLTIQEIKSSNDKKIISYFQEKMEQISLNLHSSQIKMEKLRDISTSRDFQYLLSNNASRIIPSVYEDPEKLIKFVVQQCSQHFIEAVTNSFGGYFRESQGNDLKFIIVAEGCNKILELLTTALWFWDNCSLATWQIKYSKKALLRTSCNCIKHRFESNSRIPVFNVWLAEGVRHIIRTRGSKCVLVDVPKSRSLSRKELSFLLFGHLDLPPELKIKIIMVTQCDMDGENVVNSVEGILDKIQSYLKGNSQVTFSRARQMYRELRIDNYYAVGDEAKNQTSKNSAYYMTCMKQDEMMTSRRKYFNRKQ